MGAKARVGLVHGADRRSGVYQALDLVRADVEAKLHRQALIKPICYPAPTSLLPPCRRHPQRPRFLMSAAPAR